MKTLFFGAGSMAHALVSGAIEAKVLERENVTITNRSNKKRLLEFAEHFDVKGVSGHLAPEFDVVILAMKPKDFHDAAPSIRRSLSSNTLVISVLAGISLQHIRESLAFDGAIARAMPNTSASLRKSATAITCNELLTEKQREWTLELFRSVGYIAEVQEHQMNLITAVSGSGPAYIYYVVELLEKAAIDTGMPEELAKALILQTISGAASMLEHSGLEAGMLRKNVTSPGGTTEAGIGILEESGIGEAFMKCVDAARNRAEEMGNELAINRMR
ncbi:pyrroline-5-carboxylate reductase [Rossellomorea aquimaris]|uniref:pyrroline-5-carboxylate reductase n=1 Tax=Rossellomorea aquimaris TaxID=189382 RepID=UPI001CD3A68F|nr:pyrroline-5-carboxylate reductase [Rossellomorea aquimaris]MCA1054736.1 pyrroline-5-carboxylate reductase [Rossellomorea aquimaris]